ncbi:diguanylate cyclase [Marispirochaeta sp.]|jgi:diguanylate cyclase (GGDEF)-like protein|uniref:GGDEF domain-containing response regulator n=1 Tax=Marispirochaeta sp. TaxID=2038653 RepID=UPI0029C8E16A|nr:diguanylate cyclase [Marispirochaeta sp.]
MTRILLIDSNSGDLEKMNRYLVEEGYGVLSAGSSGEALSYLKEEDIHIILIDLDVTDPPWRELAIEFRKRYFQCPLQIILTAHEKQRLNDALEEGADDYIQKPVRKLEFQTRIKAAYIRLRSQMRLFEEREFFRQAVKQEEELASKILDRHLHLKQTLEVIETEKEELERTKAKLERIAKYDMLSGLLNRMSLFSIIDIEIDRALRTEVPLSGIMMDIDHFKPINDNYGHPVGDMVIKEIGNLLQETLRKYDQAGRYGGEEFFMVLPNTYKDQAFAIAERFRLSLMERKIDSGDFELSVTASLGVAQYHSGESREAWIARADAAMYRAKQNGRNLTRIE